MDIKNAKICTLLTNYGSFHRWAAHLFSKMLILFKFSTIFSFANLIKQFKYFLSIKSCPDSGSVRGTSSPWVLRTANTIFPDLPKVRPEFRYPLSILEKMGKYCSYCSLLKWSKVNTSSLFVFQFFLSLKLFDVLAHNFLSQNGLRMHNIRYNFN